MSVTAAQGFRAAGVTAGLKASGTPDVAVVVNDGPRRAAAAVFTANRVAAAPVLWSRQAVSDGRADAVVGSWDMGIRSQPVWTWLSGFRLARFFTSVQ